MGDGTDQDGPGENWPGLESLPEAPPVAWPWRTLLPAPAADPVLPGRRRPSPRLLLALLAVLIGTLTLARRSGPDLEASAPTTASAPTSTAPSTTSAPIPTTTIPPATTTTTTPPSLPDPALDAAVGELSAIVARARGHAFTMPLSVSRLDDADFEGAARAAFDRDALAREGAFLKIVGLVRPDQDYATVFIDRSVSHMGGFFDPRTKQVRLRGAPRSPVTDDLKEVLVHELTHVLDDQLFPFDRPTVHDPGTEVAFGFEAVSEGDAQRVAHDWSSRLGRVPVIGRGVYPDAVSAGIDAKYDFGEILVNDARARGGEAEVDRSLADPPLTSEQVLHPEKYAAREPALAVDRPPAEGAAHDGPPIGELMLHQLLSGSTDPDDATRAAAGWGGDCSVLWTQAPRAGGKTCLRTRYAMDTPTDLDELEGAFREWATRARDRTVTRSGDRLDVTTCARVPPPAGVLPD